MLKSKSLTSRPAVLSLMDLRVHPISDSEVVSLVSKAIADDERCIIANHNLHSVYLWYHERRMRQFYDAAEYIHIDGMFLILLANMVGIPLGRANRATSLDFFPILAPLAAQEHWRIFYLGSKPGVAARAAAGLQAQYPGLQMHTHHGHFDANATAAENKEVLAEINAYSPQILLVGMGMPRQEIWILENQEHIAANVVFPAGAFMDYMAGEIPTAPRWLASLYLEWMYRLFSEPARLWRRYLVEPWFVAGQIAKYYLRPHKPHVTPQDSPNE